MAPFTLRETQFTKLKSILKPKLWVSNDNAYSSRCSSFFSTAAALLYKRIKDTENFELIFMSVYVDGEKYVHVRDSHKNFLCVIQSEDVQNTFVEENNFIQQKSITEFFAREFLVKCYINNEDQSAILITDKDFSSFHKIQSVLPMCLPWFFEKLPGVGVVLSQNEMGLLGAIREENEDKYIFFLNKIFEDLDLDQNLRKEKIKEFSEVVNYRTINIIKNEITSQERKIKELYRDIILAQDVLRQKQAILLGFQLQVSKGDELMDYLLLNKNIKIDSVSDEVISFFVTTTFEYFDEDIVKRVLENPNSYVNSSGFTYPIKKLFEKVFMERVWKLKVAAGYQIDYQGGVRSRVTPDTLCEDHLPNIHIDRYNCFGDYARVFAECAKNLDFVGLFEQCIASCMSLNFADTTVMESFVYYIVCHLDTKCVVTKDGAITLREAFELLNKEESNDRP